LGVRSVKTSDHNEGVTSGLPDLFQPHPHLSDAINRNIVQSEMEGGVWLARVPVGTHLEVQTMNNLYKIIHLGDGDAMISGHPEICPEPVRVHISGSNWGGSMLKTLFIGRGMHMEFRDPQKRRIVTSPVVEIREKEAVA